MNGKVSRFRFGRTSTVFVFLAFVHFLFSLRLSYASENLCEDWKHAAAVFLHAERSVFGITPDKEVAEEALKSLVVRDEIDKCFSASLKPPKRELESALLSDSKKERSIGSIGVALSRLGSEKIAGLLIERLDDKGDWLERRYPILALRNINVAYWRSGVKEILQRAQRENVDGVFVEYVMLFHELPSEEQGRAYLYLLNETRSANMVRMIISMFPYEERPLRVLLENKLRDLGYSALVLPPEDGEHRVQ